MDQPRFSKVVRVTSWLAGAYLTTITIIFASLVYGVINDDFIFGNSAHSDASVIITCILLSLSYVIAIGIPYVLQIKKRAIKGYILALIAGAILFPCLYGLWFIGALWGLAGIIIAFILIVLLFGYTYRAIKGNGYPSNKLHALLESLYLFFTSLAIAALLYDLLVNLRVLLSSSYSYDYHDIWLPASLLTGYPIAALIIIASACPVLYLGSLLYERTHKNHASRN